MVGAGISMYRGNFGCKEGSKKRPYKTTFRVKLYELFIDYYRYNSKYDDDLFVGIAQWLMKTGIPNRTNTIPYPYIVFVDNEFNNVDKFLRKALFSRDPFFAEYLDINAGGFDLLEWRKQFDLFAETTIVGLKYYRNRASMPIENFKDFNSIKKIIYTNSDFYNKEVNKLNFSPNQCHKDAIWIISKRCFIYPRKFIYFIDYGCEDDYINAKNKKAHSSWEIEIESFEDENYVDFCLRIHDNYNNILNGDIQRTSQYGSRYALNNILEKEVQS